VICGVEQKQKMTKELKWRLGKLPTSNEVLELLKEKLITKEEARDILFNEVEVGEEKTTDELMSEIKFLKELVENLSKGNNTKIVETIRYIEKPYYHNGWYQPYQNWTYCTASSSLIAGSGSASSRLTAGSGPTTGVNAVNCSFSAIS